MSSEDRSRAPVAVAARSGSAGRRGARHDAGDT